MPLASLHLPVINFATDFGDITLQINDGEKCLTGHSFFFPGRGYLIGKAGTQE
jgi:hypothetical protein